MADKNIKKEKKKPKKTDVLKSSSGQRTAPEVPLVTKNKKEK